MAHNKRLKSAESAIDRSKNYGIDDAVKLVKTNARAKFDETVELSLNFGHRSAPCRPDGPRPDQPAQRHRQDACAWVYSPAT